MSWMNVRATWRVAGFAALLCLLSGMHSASAQTKIAIGYTVVSPSVLPLWIADEQGIFRKHDLEVNLVVHTGPGGGMSRLLGTQFQFGLNGSAAVILAALDRSDLKILAPLTSGRISALLVARRDVKEPGDLRGKRFGVISLGTGAWVSAMLALEQLGLDAQRDSISFKAVGNQIRMVQALKAGEVDAVVLDPAQATQLRSEGYPILLDLHRANLYGAQSAFTTTEEYARTHPEVVQKVLTAVVEATAYACAAANKGIVLSTLMKHMQITDAAAAESGYQSFLQNVSRKPYPLAERLQNLQRIIALHEPRALTVKAGELVDDRFVRKLDEGGVIDRLYSAYGVK